MVLPVPTRIAFLGCGNIAGAYAKSMTAHPELALVGVFDLETAKRDLFAAEHNCTGYRSLDELCADDPEIVVNLTTAPHHYSTTLDLIGRGRTVFSEKPLALHPLEARDLVERAVKQQVRLACAPSVWLGPAQQATATAVRDGAVGTVRLINAEVNQGRIESWHPAPSSFYRVGPVVDAGIYPIAFLTSVFGSVSSVTAVATTALSERITLGGEKFSPHTEDAWVIVAAFASGPLLRLSCTFYVSSETVPRTIDFHGDAGSLRLHDWIMPGSRISRADYGTAYAEQTPLSGYTADDAAEIDWSLGLADLAAAIGENRPHRTGAEHAAHVVDVLDAVALSAQQGTRVEVTSTFPSPVRSPANMLHPH